MWIGCAVWSLWIGCAAWSLWIGCAAWSLWVGCMVTVDVCHFTEFITRDISALQVEARINGTEYYQKKVCIFLMLRIAMYVVQEVFHIFILSS